MVYYMLLVRQFLKDLFYKNLMFTQGSYPLYVPSILFIVLGCSFPALRFCMGVCALVHALIFLFFFRNPERVCEAALQDSSLIIAPCDGKILAIDYQNSEQPGYTQKISIFLSPLDVHVNWIPVTGVIENVAYHQGSFYPAFLPKASQLNERNDVVVTTVQGNSLKLRQITGTLARTIVCWVTEGQEVTVGQKYGMMKFGSRIDLFLPSTVVLAVKNNERVWGGLTVIGRW